MAELEEMAAKMEEEAVVIRKFLDSNYGDFDSQDAEQYVGHPVNSLALIARLSHHLPRSGVTDILANNSTSTSRKNLAALTSTFPKESDWKGAANGLFLLQEHYGLDIGHLAEGAIRPQDQQLVGLADQASLQGQHSLEPEELLQIG